MRVYLFAFALALSNVACSGEEQPENVLWTTRCNMQCGQESVWTEPATACSTPDDSERGVAEELANICVGILIGEGCPAASAKCFCEANKSDTPCS